jgi:hypothetical protein
MTQGLSERIIATKDQASEYALAYEKLDDAAARNAWAAVANLLSDIMNLRAAITIDRGRLAVSDLALIDMHIPNILPLESGSSDFGFVNKFDASGRSLSGGDIA